MISTNFHECEQKWLLPIYSMSYSVDNFVRSYVTHPFYKKNQTYIQNKIKSFFFYIRLTVYDLQKHTEKFIYEG